MSAQTTPENTQSDEQQGPVIRLLLAIRGSFLYTVMTIGVTFVVLGVLNQQLTFVRPLMSGMFFMWGISAIVYGILGIGALRLIGYN